MKLFNLRCSGVTPTHLYFNRVLIQHILFLGTHPVVISGLITVIMVGKFEILLCQNVHS